MSEKGNRPLLPTEDVEKLLAWYRQNKRQLPWRETNDAYRIWVSEIMLQQTRVEAVRRYYERFLTAFPTIFDLANADEEQLLKLWEGLGYYSRAKNLQKTAKTVVSDYGGHLPADVAKLRKLTGIGDYTAGAIASIAYGLPEPAVDGNLLRVLSRYAGCYDDITLPTVKKAWSERLRSSIPQDKQHASEFTQAMIELGAVICVPNGDAKCEFCPFSEHCKAKAENLTDVLPMKAKAKPRRIEDKTVLVIRNGEKIALHKRADRGLLAGLYELPNVVGHLNADGVTALVRKYGFEPLRVEELDNAKHIFTHIEWHMTGYLVKIADDLPSDTNGGVFLADLAELREKYAIPSAFSAYTNDL